MNDIALSHEYGHAPTYVNPHKNKKEFYEYVEVLPIFFEYLACLALDRENAMKKFLDIRLDLIKEGAQDFFHQKKSVRGNGSYSDQHYINNMDDAYKYIKSFEYVLQLIDRFHEDSNMVNKELDKYVYGEKTMRELSSSLDINTAGCKKLLKL